MIHHVVKLVGCVLIIIGYVCNAMHPLQPVKTVILEISYCDCKPSVKAKNQEHLNPLQFA